MCPFPILRGENPWWGRGDVKSVESAAGTIIPIIGAKFLATQRVFYKSHSSRTMPLQFSLDEPSWLLLHLFLSLRLIQSRSVEPYS